MTPGLMLLTMLLSHELLTIDHEESNWRTGVGRGVLSHPSQHLPHAVSLSCTSTEGVDIMVIMPILQMRKLRRRERKCESGRSPGGRNVRLLQYSFLEKPHGQRSLAGSVHGVARVGHNN